MLGLKHNAQAALKLRTEDSSRSKWRLAACSAPVPNIAGHNDDLPESARKPPFTETVVEDGRRRASWMRGRAVKRPRRQTSDRATQKHFGWPKSQAKRPILPQLPAISGDLRVTVLYRDTCARQRSRLAHDLGLSNRTTRVGNVKADLLRSKVDRRPYLDNPISFAGQASDNAPHYFAHWPGFASPLRPASTPPLIPSDF